MKTETIKASLMINAPVEAKLINFDLKLTKEDHIRGLDHIYDKALRIILGRLTVVIDEDNLREVFEECQEI